MDRHEQICYASTIWLWIQINFRNILWQDKAKNTHCHKFKFSNSLFMAVITFYFICKDICLLVWKIFCILYLIFCTIVSTLENFPQSWIIKITTFIHVCTWVRAAGVLGSLWSLGSLGSWSLGCTLYTICEKNLI